MAENDVKNAGQSVTSELKGELKKQKGFWGKFGTFMAMGGFILVLIFVVGIIVAVSLIFNIK